MGLAQGHNAVAPVINFFVIYLILNMLILDVSCYENNVDPDQLASQKPADLDLHCLSFHSACK